jgi:hypothetical protein
LPPAPAGIELTLAQELEGNIQRTKSTIKRQVARASVSSFPSLQYIPSFLNVLFLSLLCGMKK